MTESFSVFRSFKSTLLLGPHAVPMPSPKAPRPTGPHRTVLAALPCPALPQLALPFLPACLPASLHDCGLELTPRYPKTKAFRKHGKKYLADVVSYLHNALLITLNTALFCGLYKMFGYSGHIYKENTYLNIYLLSKNKAQL